MRYIGIVSVFLLCAAAGIYVGQAGKKKILFYVEFKRILTLIKGEIRYGITPIGEACSHISEKTTGVFREFLSEIASQIRKKSKQSFPEIWKQTMEHTLPKCYFSENEWEQLKQIGASLGYMDVEMQLKSLDLMLEQVERSLAEARMKQEKDGKIYQTLGVGIGLMLVIVLI